MKQSRGVEAEVVAHIGEVELRRLYARLAPHLTRQNSETVLKRASGMSQRELRELVSELEPRPDVVSTVRNLVALLLFSPVVVRSLREFATMEKGGS